ncbi:hypothetical protein [Ichthyenterobacterium magnum]|nr:hypothetical protein [Ichthyenterobacterium magnum]
MNSKWYFSTLIIILALLGGIASQQQTSVPNQEIVLQFNDDEVTSNEAQNTITIVKEQLEAIGVDNIQILDLEQGQLKITYYSDADISSIKKIFSKDKTLAFDDATKHQEESPAKIPSENKSVSYNLDVFEIHNGSDIASGLSGKLALESKTGNDRFFNPNTFMSIKETDDKEDESIIKVAYKLRRDIAIAIDNTSYKIPEVRAGPVLS